MSKLRRLMNRLSHGALTSVAALAHVGYYLSWLFSGFYFSFLFCCLLLQEAKSPTGTYFQSCG